MLEQPLIKPSPGAQASVKRVGLERTPVIVIDNYAEDCGATLAHAHQQSYSQSDNSYYPGIRAPLPKSYVISLLKPLIPYLRQVYAVPAHFNLIPHLAYYSLVSNSPESLALVQRIPHFDNNNPFYLAVLHYLNPGDFGGTAFFRHKPTGFERISNERVEEYLQVSSSYFEREGPPEQAYITGSSGLYTLSDRIDYKPNRLAVYPGNLLHSGIIDPLKDISADPALGRLTANLFIEFKPTERS